MRRAGGHLAHLQDPGGEPHHRLHGVGLALVRAAAVERDARPHQVEMIARAQERAAGVGKARRRRRQLGAQLLEALRAGARSWDRRRRRRRPDGS